jgi:hypothetical protein
VWMWVNNFRNHLARRIFLTSLITSLGVSVAMVLVMALAGGFTQTRGELLLTALTCSGFSITGLGAVPLYQRGKYRPLPGVGLLASLLGVSLVAVGIWTMPDSDWYWRTSATVSIIAVSLGLICLLLLWEPRGLPARYIWYTVIPLASLLASVAILATILGIKADLFWRWLAVLAVADALAGIGALVLAWFPRCGPTHWNSEGR